MTWLHIFNKPTLKKPSKSTSSFKAPLIAIKAFTRRTGAIRDLNVLSETIPQTFGLSQTCYLVSNSRCTDRSKKLLVQCQLDKTHHLGAVITIFFKYEWTTIIISRGTGDNVVLSFFRNDVPSSPSHLHHLWKSCSACLTMWINDVNDVVKFKHGHISVHSPFRKVLAYHELRYFDERFKVSLKTLSYYTWLFLKSHCLWMWVYTF